MGRTSKDLMEGERETGADSTWLPSLESSPPALMAPSRVLSTQLLS
jgi:hypothetical protein